MAFELELKRSKKPVYPTKTTINLVESNQPPRHVGRNVTLFALAMVGVLAFAKFGVMDVMATAQAATAKAAAAQNELSAVLAENANFEELEKQYAAFAVNSLTEEERYLADRGEVLDLLSRSVAGSADLQSVDIKGNAVQLQFVNTSLDEVSKVVASLEDEEIVVSVNLSTAKTDKYDDVVSTVTIYLKGSGQPPAEEAEGAEAPAQPEGTAAADGKGASNE